MFCCLTGNLLTLVLQSLFLRMYTLVESGGAVAVTIRSDAPFLQCRLRCATVLASWPPQCRVEHFTASANAVSCFFRVLFVLFSQGCTVSVDLNVISQDRELFDSRQARVVFRLSTDQTKPPISKAHRSAIVILVGLSPLSCGGLHLFQATCTCVCSPCLIFAFPTLVAVPWMPTIGNICLPHRGPLNSSCGALPPTRQTRSLPSLQASRSLRFG